MSIERELLRRISSHSGTTMDTHFIKEIQALLTQPEQEPVAWKVVDRTTGDFMFSRVKPMERSYKYDMVIPLYIAPKNRGHLCGEDILRGFEDAEDAENAIDLYSYLIGIAYAEKYHGIGGGE